MRFSTRPLAALRFAGAALIGACTACSGWSRVSQDRPMHPPAFNLFEVYSEGKRHLLHSLQVEGDSIRGIPSGDSRQCDACRIALATTDVDSVRTGGTDKSSTVGFGVVSGVILGYCLLVLAAYGAGAGGT